jgi:acetyl esterase/lipase
VSRPVVVTGPGVTVHRDSVGEWCGSGPMGGARMEPLAHDLELVFPETIHELIEIVAACPADKPIVVTTRANDTGGLFERIPEAAERRIVSLELEAAAARRTDANPLIRGRGVNGYHWAIRTAHWRWQLQLRTESYGSEPEHVGDLRLPVGRGPFPVGVIVHGGYYREQWERDTAEPIAVDMVRRGFATWNIEYRRTGPGSGGGWPRTFEDVAAAVDHLVVLARDHPLDLGRVVICGHSAGGHLALWAAARTKLPAGVPGAAPVVTPALAVSLAGVVDLATAADRGAGFGHNPISALMGDAGSGTVPVRRCVAAPAGH